LPAASGVLEQTSRDVLDGYFSSKRSFIPYQGLHSYEVNDAEAFVIAHEGELYRDGIGAEFFTEHLNGPREIRPYPIELIDKDYSRYTVSIRLTPDRFCLGLNAPYRAQNRNHAIKHPQTPLYFYGEIYMTRRIDEMNFVIFPMEGRRRGGNGYAPFLLLGHVIHGRRTFVNLSYFVNLFSIKQYALGQSGLARVNVRGDPNISYFR
jgi:hypothetical protein